MFGLFKKANERQKIHIDKYVELIVFYISNILYLSEKIEEKDQAFIRSSSKQQFNVVIDTLLTESKLAKLKNSAICDAFITEELKPAAQNLESDMKNLIDRYELVYKRKFKQDIVEDAIDNGWSAWN
jgi:hypothetical protein